ncbi:MAG: rane dipeptidase, partial [Brevundimonas sp.]|nr:rane dipeptidase [Brevundimonas sp.]
MIRSVLLAAASFAILVTAANAQADPAGGARVREILKTTPLIDGHNDLPWALCEGHGNDPHAVDLDADLTTAGL